jgi:diguanylate cyclase (GGDEF)-like protein/PAS domain S-box-containing protein
MLSSPQLVVVGSYNWYLVALSVLISVLASYAALDVAGRIFSARGRIRSLWLGFGAFAMGTGIWSMHYIGMLAFRLPVPVSYDWPTVVLSLLAAVFASATALFVVTRLKMGFAQAMAGSVLMGLAIASMHYIGMAAMRLPAVCHYSSGIVTVSIILAIAISWIALWLAFHFRSEARSGGWQKTLSAVAMGTAIPVMHYAGMAAASFTRSGSSSGAVTNALTITSLGTTVVVVVTLTVLGIALLTSLVDRRFSAQTLELEFSEKRSRQILESALDAFIGMDSNGTIIDWNAQAAATFGWPRDEAVGQSLFTMIIPERYRTSDAKGARNFLATGEDGLLDRRVEMIACRRNGQEFPIEIAVSSSQWGETRLFTAFLRDISNRRDMEEALFAEKERAQVTLNSIADAVACTDISGKITFLNMVAERMTGWSHIDAAGKPMADVLGIVDATSRKATANPMELAPDENRTIQIPSNAILVRQDGVEIPIEDSVARIHDRKGATTGTVIVFRDVSAARAMSLQLSHAAEHDFLTGLPNRMLLNDRINQATILASQNRKKVAILFLDLDGFKHINDSLGHATGDKLLKSVAARLIDCVRDSDTVSRQGGDEFVVLLSEVGQAEDAAITARRLLQAIASPYFIDGHDLHITTSIGVSVFPDDGVDAETIIKNADTAMYQAKENGWQSYKFFTASMNERAVQRQSIEEGLRRALERKEFAVYYQPKINLRTGRMSGAEALLRWTHPTRGLISPAEFIPVAEDSGLIVEIGKWVLREACQQAQAWIIRGFDLPTIAVNISAMEFRQERFLEGVMEVLKETNFNPRRLELELTESALMRHVEATESILKVLRATGVQIAIDDFGTGYSSLSYLRKFPIDALKIDQSFVRQITTNPDDSSIVTAVISMGRSLKLRVVAEGVETLNELEFLKAHQCDEAQGYYFSRPVSAEQFVTLLGTAAPEPPSSQATSSTNTMSSPKLLRIH